MLICGHCQKLYILKYSIEVASANGFISVFDLSPPGKEHFTKLKGHIYEKIDQARIIQWRHEQKELIVAYENGIVTFFSTIKGAPVYIFEPHSSPITQMVWDSKNKLLLTGSKDKSVKAWRLPDKWSILSGKQEASKPIKPVVSLSDPSKKSAPKKEGSDSEDDLAGWND